MEPGDIIRVTRFRKHWLFGERVSSVTNLKRKDALRGWFPRRCAIELENDSVDNFECINTTENNVGIRNKIPRLRSKWIKSSIAINDIR